MRLNQKKVLRELVGKICKCGNKKNYRAKLCRKCWLKSNKSQSKDFIQKRIGHLKGKNHHNWKGGKPISKCIICGKEFEGWYNNQNKYCSRKCFSIGQSKNIKGKKNRFWNGGEKNWKKKENLYSSLKWRELRLKILKEDKKCLICGTTENLHIHHKKRYKEGGENIRENLVTLCLSHHQKIHTLEIFYKNNHSPRKFKDLMNEIKRKEHKTEKR